VLAAVSRPLLDTSIFDRERTHEEARRAHKLEHIYHAGQQKVWDGKEVLAELIAKHGPIRLSLEKRTALAKVFSGLMWGELAAWKISAQLADMLDDFEAKMAATSQVHDEARHFYVLHDYLQQLDVEIPPLNRPTRMLLEGVLKTENVLEKLIGMQLFVESMALTVFKIVRDLAIEPVLTELLLYFERDESRHVGLGVQHTPDLVRTMSAIDRARLAAFQLKMMVGALTSLKSMEKEFRILGVDPRAVAATGREKTLFAIGLLHEANGEAVNEVAGPVYIALFDATCELLFSRTDGRLSLKSVVARVVDACAVAAGGEGRPLGSARA
jgi:hypothetical protein